MTRTATLGACAAAVLVLAGCGEPEPVRTDRPVLRITLDEYRIIPQNIVVTLSPKHGGRLKLAVRNRGRLTHNLVVQIPPEEFRARPEEVGRTKTMQPQEEAPSVKLRLPPGKYRLVCTVANHDDLGQTGELEVKE